MFNIKVGVLPGSVSEFIFEAPTSVKDIFAKAGVATKDKLLKLDGRVVELTTMVSSGNYLVATAQVKGN